MLRRVLLVSLLLLPLVTLPALARAANLPAEVADDFRPLSGYVVMPLGDEFLIDLDAAKGVHEGDLFAVVVPGEKVVHPVTKEVIGTLDQVKGFLQVTRIKSGYSYARPLAGAKGIAKGDRIRRFVDMPAYFWDYTGQGEGLYAELRAALPQLDWHGYAADQAKRPEVPRAPKGLGAALIFVLNDNGLGVKDGSLKPLRFYSRAATVAPAPAPLAATSVPAPRPAATPATGPSAIVTTGAGQAPTPNSGIVQVAAQSAPGIWMSPTFSGEPAGLAVGDFDGDGKQETALAFPDHLEFYRLQGTDWAALGKLSLPARLKAVSLEGADLTGDGRPELYVTAADGETLASLAVDWTGGNYRVAITDIPWYLRTVDLPGEGPVLLGQLMGDGQHDFSGEIFRVLRSGGELRKGASVAVPPLVDLFGFMPFRQGEGPTLFANLNVNSDLQVLTADGDKLWQGSDNYGGREAFIERRDTSQVQDLVMRRVYLKADIQAGPAGALLIPINEGSRLLTNMREFKASRLAALGWDGNSLRELWHTQPQGGYLAAFRVADIDNDGAAEIAMTVLFSHKGFFTKARGSLVVYELP